MCARGERCVWGVMGVSHRWYVCGGSLAGSVLKCGRAVGVVCG